MPYTPVLPFSIVKMPLEKHNVMPPQKYALSHHIELEQIIVKTSGSLAIRPEGLATI